jgi:hypothetical protein
MKRFLTILHIFLLQSLFSQRFINGSFENNVANGIDQINLSNADLNSKLPGVTAFGTYGDVDIIKSSAYGGGGAQDKNWYIAITGGGTDIIALTLSQPLVKGKKYRLSFYDRKDGAHASHPVQVGLSLSNSAFGSVIYTSPEVPVLNVWTRRTFTFIATDNAKFITVQMQSGGISDWANIDNFVLGDAECNDVLTIESSARVINKGGAVTFTVHGGNSYTWASSLRSISTGSILNDKPFANTIYTVISSSAGCDTLKGIVSVVINDIIKDTVIAKKIDTIKIINNLSANPRFVKFNRKRLNGRKYKIQETILVTNPSIKIMVWDKNRVDGDIVSIYLNGQLLEENLEVSKTKKEIAVNLKTGRNVIVMYAINLGFIPPNTAAIGVNNGKHKQITLVSDLKRSGALEIIYNSDAVTIR